MAAKGAREKSRPAAPRAPAGRLESVLRSGGFAVTAELGPPKGVDVAAIRRKIDILKGWVDAANVTDNQTAVVRLSSIATSAILVREGLEPVVQMVARDRNRIAIQSDILGAAALGVRNVLCLSGDHQGAGSEPGAANVYDIDSVQMLAVLKGLRDEGRFAGGGEVGGRPPLFLGAAWSPAADPQEIRVARLDKKVRAGAQFVQTQGVFDVDAFRGAVGRAGDAGLLDKVFVLAGIIPLKSAGMARHMAREVPGVSIPDAVVARLAAAGKAAREEGTRIAVETIQAVREIPGVRGVHIMAIEWEANVPEIVRRAGLGRSP
jgi:methylenetetrahydrofolate reductase (NADPH)